MKRCFLALSFLVTSITYAQDPIQFHCKESYQTTMDQMVAFSMVKLNALESGKGLFYEAIMGKEAYIEAMAQTYQEIKQENNNKNDATMELTFNFENFESPINELVRKINRKQKLKTVSYEQVAKIILENSQSERFCPQGKPMNINQIAKDISKDI